MEHTDMTEDTTGQLFAVEMMMAALFLVLENKKILTSQDLDRVFDMSTTAIELSSESEPSVEASGARQYIDMLSRKLRPAAAT